MKPEAIDLLRKGKSGYNWVQKSPDAPLFCTVKIFKFPASKQLVSLLSGLQQNKRINKRIQQNQVIQTRKETIYSAGLVPGQSSNQV